MRALLPVVFATFALPALAGVNEAIEQHILPGYDRFATVSATLSDAARNDCTAEALKPAFNAAFDSWLGVAHLRFGPVETDGRALYVAFWPDKKGFTTKALGRLIAAKDPASLTPDGFAEVSVAAHGFFALERMLYDPAFNGYGASDYACALTQTIAADLAATAASVNADWQNGFATTLRTAGAEGNRVFLSEDEAKQALLTSLVSGLEFIETQRLGRPLGSFDKPRPKRAEAWRSGRAQRNIKVSLRALHEYTTALADGEAPETMEIFKASLRWIDGFDDPTLAGVSDPVGRMAIESQQQFLSALREAAGSELSAHLRVDAGFNALDGD